MNVGIQEVDLRQFNAIVRDLARISGRDFADALKSQVGAVLKAAIRLTGAANRATIKARMSAGGSFIRFNDGTVIARWKKSAHALMFLENSNFSAASNPKTRVPLNRGGKTWHQMNDPRRRWSAERWGRYQAAEAQAQSEFSARAKGRKTDLKAALAARGLAKQSWLQIGHSLGLATSTLGAPGFAERAVPSNGRRYRNGTSRQENTSEAVTITIRNDNNLITHFTKPTGESILERAVQMRVTAFRSDMERGVFDDVKTRAARYPGVFTTR
jgi:hypothetical protein